MTQNQCDVEPGQILNLRRTYVHQHEAALACEEVSFVSSNN